MVSGLSEPRVGLPLASQDLQDAPEHERGVGQVSAGDWVSWVQTKDLVTMMKRLVESMRTSREVPGRADLHSSLIAEAASPTHAANGFFKDRFAELPRLIRADIRKQQTDSKFTGSWTPKRTKQSRGHQLGAAAYYSFFRTVSRR